MSLPFRSSDFKKWLLSRHQEAFVASPGAVPAEYLGHPWLWISSSGTTADSEVPPRILAHSRQSLLNSASSVCEFLQVDANDRWARILPLHHMAGLSLDVRAEVSGCKIIDGAPDWNPAKTAEWLTEEKATLVSVVPTQIYDWVKNHTSAPPSLRQVIVGADHLDEQLATEAKLLGWPIVASYGLTETASMIACQKTASSPTSSWLDLLPHAEVSLNNEGLFCIQASSLFSAELKWNENTNCYSFKSLEELGVSRTWDSEDFGEVIDRKIKILGRRGDLVKILGSLVNLPELDQRLRALLKRQQITHLAAFVARKDARKGHQLELVVEGSYNLKTETNIINLWNQNCLGLHRVEKISWVDVLPRTALGKLKRKELLRSDSSSER